MPKPKPNGAQPDREPEIETAPASAARPGPSRFVGRNTELRALRGAPLSGPGKVRDRSCGGAGRA